MPKDQQYLLEAVRKGHLCPGCRQGFLRVNNNLEAVCIYCKAKWSTWQALFTSTAKDMGWSADAWERWLEAHPDYKETSEHN